MTLLLGSSHRRQYCLACLPVFLLLDMCLWHALYKSIGSALAALTMFLVKEVLSCGRNSVIISRLLFSTCTEIACVFCQPLAVSLCGTRDEVKASRALQALQVDNVSINFRYSGTDTLSGVPSWFKIWKASIRAGTLLSCSDKVSPCASGIISKKRSPVCWSRCAVNIWMLCLPACKMTVRAISVQVVTRATTWGNLVLRWVIRVGSSTSFLIRNESSLHAWLPCSPSNAYQGCSRMREWTVFFLATDELRATDRM